ncbi:hypothetical protein E2C01_011252 [Portunus trituberculatus]|uniref:Uncharacterized protein n=1 Tax=Portunus trituberculatus TaxID=210409 RepID=A0A5B7DAL9_PORTR|nr:hypothetical protein [Portunus trituberculatus]
MHARLSARFGECGIVPRAAAADWIDTFTLGSSTIKPESSFLPRVHTYTLKHLTPVATLTYRLLKVVTMGYQTPALKIDLQGSLQRTQCFPGQHPVGEAGMRREGVIKTINSGDREQEDDDLHHLESHWTHPRRRTGNGTP